MQTQAKLATDKPINEINEIPFVETYRVDQTSGEATVSGRRYIYGPDDQLISDVRRQVKREYPDKSASWRKTETQRRWDDSSAKRLNYQRIVEGWLKDCGLEVTETKVNLSKKDGRITSARTVYKKMEIASYDDLTLANKEEQRAKIIDLEKIVKEQSLLIQEMEEEKNKSKAKVEK